jgi:hypothetical protein
MPPPGAGGALALAVLTAVSAPLRAAAGADSVVVPCAHLSSNATAVFPPPVVTTISWNDYSNGMICGVMSADPLDPLFVAWAGRANSMSGPREYALRNILVSTAAGFNTASGPGAWRQPWPSQEGINLFEGGLDVGCWSSSTLANTSAIVLTAYCSGNGPCGCIASYPLEVAVRPGDARRASGAAAPAPPAVVVRRGGG